MAHTIVGVDLGAHAVKFALVEAGFRQSRVLGVFAEPVLPGELPLGERQAEAMRRGLDRLPQESTLYLTIPGELCTLRVLDLPFADERKIDQVVGYELEGQIVHALADVVFDHRVLETPGPEGTQVLAVAARLDDVGGLLAEVGAYGVDPRSLFPAPLVYQAVLDDEAAPMDGAPPLACRVILDIGHLRTNVCVMNGDEAITARTILRGGAALTAAIAQAYRCDEAMAEDIKLSRALVASAARPASTSDELRLDAALKEALSPLLRDVRQTIASVRARLRTPVQSLLLTGGTARLTGLADYLAEELEVPVQVWSGRRPDAVPRVEADEETTEVDPAIDGVDAVTADTRFAVCTAAAWAGARGSKQIDLRRGPFVYKASLSILRQKAAHLGALGAAIIVCITIDATMALGRLRGEREMLQAQLKSQTQELFGEPRLDGRQVTTLLRRSFKDEMAPVPKATAYDILGEISRKAPPNDDIKLDILELDIRPKKVFIRGTVGSAAAVDTLQEKLGTIDCFEEITKGPINEVSGGAKSFSLTIASKC
jgi:general secretion pathway protein L